MRLVDCVGYLVPGALGNMEDGKERMVTTPWFEEQIPFSKAAEVGTEKVIRDHSVIGIVVTTDGSFGDLPRNSFTEAEEKTVSQLKELHKPFVVILNSATPQSAKSKDLAAELAAKYQVPVLLVNCQKMSEENFEELFEKPIYQFPASEIRFDLPGYLDALPEDHWIKATMIESVRNWMDSFENIGQVMESCNDISDGKVVRSAQVTWADMARA